MVKGAERNKLKIVVFEFDHLISIAIRHIPCRHIEEKIDTDSFKCHTKTAFSETAAQLPIPFALIFSINENQKMGDLVFLQENPSIILM